jgi:hypothetical protein
VLAVEDNSITELGNNLIRSNFDQATSGAWKAEVADAGHWSVSDLVGVVSGFAPGCGAGTRQTDGQPFTYLDAATGRNLTAAYATAFFKAYLKADARRLRVPRRRAPDRHRHRRAQVAALRPAERRALVERSLADEHAPTAAPRSARRR